MKKIQKYKSGATSIYVVVIATLLFSVITVSFIRIIINEASRTTSDELAQAAYDSALAGVEDAKVALKKYYECRTGAGTECENINTAINASIASSNSETVSVFGTDYEANGYCDGVAHALGRIQTSEDKEVLIREDTSTDNDTVQAYTCVMLNDLLNDFRSSLSSATTLRVVPLRPESTVDVKDIKGVEISWFSQENGEVSNYNFNNAGNKGFKPLTDGAATPPTISATLIQTTKRYELSDFDSTSINDNRTDRGTVFLVPTESNSGSSNFVSAATLAATNNHTTENTPQQIRCKSKNDNGSESYVQSDEFGCVATIAFPDPFGANDSNTRSAETFYLILALPYGQPTTDFSVKLCTEISDGKCTGTVRFSGVQIAIDSTGRANDMYSRVEARVEFSDIYYPFPEFALQATGDSDDAIRKNFFVTADCWTRSGSSIVDCASGDSDGDNVADGPNTGESE